MERDMIQQSLEWLYRELKRIEIALGHLESRGGCDICLDGQNLEKKQAVVEWLIDRVLMEVGK